MGFKTTNKVKKVKKSISKSSAAGSPVAAKAPARPVTWLVTLVTVAPNGAVEGTWSVTLKVHDAPGARLPPVKLRRPVPLI